MTLTVGAGKRTVGVISDTHGLVRPEAVVALRGCDLLIHAGDVGKPDVLRELRELAPLVAVRGNVDTGAWAESLATPKSSRSTSSSCTCFTISAGLISIRPRRAFEW